MTSVISPIPSEMRPRLRLTFAAIALLTFLLAGCSGSGTSAPSGFNHRIFVSNAIGSGGVTPVNGVPVPPGLEIIDADNDVLSPSAISVPGAGKMVSANGITVVIDTNENDVSIVTNSSETVTQTFGTLDRALDLALTPNGGTAFAAVRNPGVLDTINTSTNAGMALNIPTISRVVISPNGTKVLAFVDDPQTLVNFPQNSFFIIDVASNTMTPVARPNGCTTTTPVTCDQPFTAVFNGSETKAFILNCGGECGGTSGSASVATVDFSGATPVFGTPISVSGATVGLLSSSTLFVAGTPPGSATGTLQAINTGTATAAAPITITNGLHTKMTMASNNRLYIGASSCTPVSDPATGQTRGCLTIFNTSSSAVVFPEFNSLRTGFDVTGIQPISNRTVVYVAQGGALDIYDTTTDNLTAIQIDIIGQAIDVIQVDQ
jgi:hypothetical protein